MPRLFWKSPNNDVGAILLTICACCACSKVGDSTAPSPRETRYWSKIVLYDLQEQPSAGRFREYDARDSLRVQYYLDMNYDGNTPTTSLVLARHFYGSNGENVRTLEKFRIMGTATASLNVLDFHYANGRLDAYSDSLYADTTRASLLSLGSYRLGYSSDGDTDTVQVETPWRGSTLRYRAALRVRDPKRRMEVEWVKIPLFAVDGSSVKFDSSVTETLTDSNDNELYITTQHPTAGSVDSLRFTYRGEKADSEYVFSNGVLKSRGRFLYNSINVEEEVRKTLGSSYLPKRGNSPVPFPCLDCAARPH